MSVPEVAAGWVAKAENDWRAVELLTASPPIIWDIACFHAQQSAEKLLKACLVVRGISPSRTHDLVRLLNDLTRAGAQGIEHLVDDCARLGLYATEARYPQFVMEPDENDGAAAVAAGRRVRTALLRELDRAR